MRVLWSGMLVLPFAVGAGAQEPVSIRVDAGVKRGAMYPMWAWFGGLYAGFYLVASLIAIPRLGAAAVFSLVIAGQMFTALVLDSTGAFGVPQIDFSLKRAIGVLLLLGGVVLLQRD